MQVLPLDRMRRPKFVARVLSTGMLVELDLLLVKLRGLLFGVRFLGYCDSGGAFVSLEVKVTLLTVFPNWVVLALLLEEDVSVVLYCSLRHHFLIINLLIAVDNAQMLLASPETLKVFLEGGGCGRLDALLGAKEL